jgi:hypothetical protein
MTPAEKLLVGLLLCLIAFLVWKTVRAFIAARRAE